MSSASSCRANLTTAAPPETLAVNNDPGVGAFSLSEAAVVVPIQGLLHQANS